MIAPGTRAPDFTLPDQDGNGVSLADFAGRRLVIAFYPLDFSSVCTDQLSIYQEVVGEIEDAERQLVGISVDSSLCHAAFREKVGISIPLLADFHPKGEVCAAYGALTSSGATPTARSSSSTRAASRLVPCAPDAARDPGANLIFDALEAAR